MPGTLGPLEIVTSRSLVLVYASTRQKGVSKETQTKSDSPGERICIDVASAKTPSLGGNKFLLGVIDDKTDFVWVKPLKRKKDQVKTMLKFLRLMKARGSPVKFIRLDNADGSNRIV